MFKLFKMIISLTQYASIAVEALVSYRALGQNSEFATIFRNLRKHEQFKRLNYFVMLLFGYH